MKEIKLTLGQVALIDDEDFDLVSRLQWRANPVRNRYYAVAVKKDGGNSLTMQAFVFGFRLGYIIDHIDGNSLNNQKSNLRWATQSQNCINKGTRRDNISGVPGVHFLVRKGKWQSCVWKQGKKISLGTFSTLEEAVEARNKGCVEAHGEFAKTFTVPSQNLV